MRAGQPCDNVVFRAALDYPCHMSQPTRPTLIPTALLYGYHVHKNLLLIHLPAQVTCSNGLTLVEIQQKHIPIRVYMYSETKPIAMFRTLKRISFGQT